MAKFLLDVAAVLVADVVILAVVFGCGAVLDARCRREQRRVNG